jgi:hypothetical protein
LATRTHKANRSDMSMKSEDKGLRVDYLLGQPKHMLWYNRGISSSRRRKAESSILFSCFPSNLTFDSRSDILTEPRPKLLTILSWWSCRHNQDPLSMLYIELPIYLTRASTYSVCPHNYKRALSAMMWPADRMNACPSFV